MSTNALGVNGWFRRANGSQLLPKIVAACRKLRDSVEGKRPRRDYNSTAISCTLDRGNITYNNPCKGAKHGIRPAGPRDNLVRVENGRQRCTREPPIARILLGAL